MNLKELVHHQLKLSLRTLPLRSLGCKNQEVDNRRKIRWLTMTKRLLREYLTAFPFRGICLSMMYCRIHLTIDIQPVKSRLYSPTDVKNDSSSLSLLSNRISDAESNLKTIVSCKLENYKSQWASEGILFFYCLSYADSIIVARHGFLLMMHSLKSI